MFNGTFLLIFFAYCASFVICYDWNCGFHSNLTDFVDLKMRLSLCPFPTNYNTNWLSSGSTTTTTTTNWNWLKRFLSIRCLQVYLQRFGLIILYPISVYLTGGTEILSLSLSFQNRLWTFKICRLRSKGSRRLESFYMYPIAIVSLCSGHPCGQWSRIIRWEKK